MKMRKTSTNNRTVILASFVAVYAMVIVLRNMDPFEMVSKLNYNFNVRVQQS